MQTIAKQVLEYAAWLPEGTPLVAKELLHFGNRAAVDQVPMKAIYLTSGRNRHLKVGAQTVEFGHAPIWQLIFPGRQPEK